MKKLYDGSLICAVLLAMFALLCGALARLDNMKWDDVKPLVEREQERLEQEELEKAEKERKAEEKPWYKKAFEKLI